MYYLDLPVHYGQLAYDKCTNTDKFESQWNIERILLKTCIVLSLLSAICFLLTAECGWYSYKSKFTLSKLMIGLTGLIIVIVSFIAYFYAESSMNFINTASLYGLIDDSYISAGKILLWVTMVAVIINTLLAFYSKKETSIVLIIAYIIIILMLVTVGGSILRRNKDLQRLTLPPKCYSMLNNSHEDSVAKFCDKKYLATSTTSCSKSYIGSYWEKFPNGSEVKDMNPSCCHPVINYYTYDIMIFGLL